MWTPPALLLILAVFVAVGPGMISQRQNAGARLYRPDFIATVLLGEPQAFRPEPAFHLSSEAWRTGLSATAGALVVAWVGTQIYRLPRRVQDALASLSILRPLHRGYIGDYVAWFMAGAAAFLMSLVLPNRAS